MQNFPACKGLNLYSCNVLQPDCMYYWTHTQTNISERAVQDVNKLPQMWPPNLNDLPEKPGLKYTEAGKDKLIRSSD